MTVFDSVRHLAQRVQVYAAARAAQGNTGPSGFWGWIKSLAGATDYLLTHPLTDITNALSGFAALVTGNGRALNDSLRRLIGWAVNNPIAALKSWTVGQIKRLIALVGLVQQRCLAAAAAALAAAKRYARALTERERRERIKADKREHAEMLHRVRWALQQVQREAASGYAKGLPAQLGILQRLADDIVTRDPLLRDLISVVIRGLLDLAEVDDPPLRLLVGFLLNHVIDHLGVDHAMGGLLARLAGPLTGQPRPRDLHDVIYDLGQRIEGLEAEWAQFMANGGPQILQAGDEWRDLTSLLVDAGLLGFFAGMTADPKGWAADVAAVGGPLVTGTLVDAARLIERA